jgi:hypothetical protein
MRIPQSIVTTRPTFVQMAGVRDVIKGGMPDRGAVGLQLVALSVTADSDRDADRRCSERDHLVRQVDDEARRRGYQRRLVVGLPPGRR